MNNLKLGIVFDVKNGKFKTEVKQNTHAIKKFGDSSQRTSAQTRQLGSSLDHTNSKLIATNKLAQSVTRGIAGMAAGFGVGFLLNEMSQTTRTFQVLRATLETATGSKEKAADAFERLQKFAASTPYSVEESIQAFIKLKNLGLDPTEAALNSYGNTASAMGKSLDQFIEAVADASVSEFERLKEFGIKAKNQGDTIAFTFRKNKTEVANNAAAIEKYLQNLGNNEFGGAMERQAATYDGALSNMGDAWDQFLLKISDDGVGDAMEDVVRGAASSLNFLGQHTEEISTLFSVGLVLAAGHAVNAISNKTAATVKDIFVTSKSVIAEKAATLQKLDSAKSENAYALMVLKSTQAQKAAAIGTVRYTAAAKAEQIARTGLNRTIVASRAAQLSYNSAVAKGTIVTRALSGSMALLGGPIGVAMLAAYAIYEFASSEDEASSKTKNLSVDVDNLTKKYKALTTLQLKSTLIDVDSAIGAQASKVKQLTKTVDKAKARYKVFTMEHMKNVDGVAAKTKETRDVFIKAEAAKETATKELNDKLALRLKLQAQLRLLAGIDDTSSILSNKKSIKEPVTDAPLGAKLANELANIEQSLLSKEDSIKASYARRLAIVDTALKGKIGQEKRYHNLTVALEAQKTAQLDALAQQKEAKQVQIAAAKVQAELNTRNQLDQSRRDGYAAELAELDGFYVAKEDADRNHKLRLLQEERDHQDAKRNLQLQNAGQYGNTVNQFVAMDRASGADRVAIATQIGGQLSATMASHSKKAFAVNQAMAIANATMQTYIAATRALAELGPIAGPIAAGVITVMGLTNVATIARQKPQGMAHDGIDEIPREGTWLLDKGERVVDKRTNQDLKQALKGGGMGSANITVNLIEDAARAGQVSQGKGLNNEDVIRIFVADIRQGGDSADAMELTYGVQRTGT